MLASRTEQDSRRARGLKSACLAGAFSANLRKRSNSTGLRIVAWARREPGVILNMGSTPNGTRRRPVPLVGRLPLRPGGDRLARPPLEPTAPPEGRVAALSAAVRRSGQLRG